MCLLQRCGQFLQCDVGFGTDDLYQEGNVRSELACGPRCAALALQGDRTPAAILSRKPDICARTDIEYPQTMSPANPS
ncbi:hypothetical protein P775_24625 [Puniceibacterium antarcticum]|uniref:Uncharacterized protein n=1 Tax=Puniceibacterium antarcticum TaxID=1206336 RepID=A0A2G8R734_9RHOB|nr:hypothetical protein P775_24625 [Puniceibacterium antarcticum]